MILLADGISTLLFASGVLLAILILLRRSLRHYRRMKRGESKKKARSPAATDPPAGLQAHDDFDRAEVRLHELSRELFAKLDSKMVAVAQLVRDADDRIARLEALLAQLEAEAQETPPGHAPAGGQTGNASWQPPLEEAASQKFREVRELAAEGWSEVTIAHRLKLSLTEVQAILAGEETP